MAKKISILIQNAEQYLHQLTPYEVINWCERYPPKTILCKKSYLNALQTLNISTHSIESKVCQLIKDIWQENIQFNIQEEKALFDQFSRYISYKDHLIKIDNLLLQNQLNNISYFFSFFLKDMDKKIVQCHILITQKNIQSTKMYHDIINNHPYNQGLIFDYLFSLNDLRLNPYIIEQILAPILNSSFKETIYIEKQCKLNNMLCKGTINYY